MTADQNGFQDQANVQQYQAQVIKQQQQQIRLQQPSHQQELEQRVHKMLNTHWQSMNAQQLEDMVLSSIKLLVELDSNDCFETLMAVMLTFKSTTSTASQIQEQTGVNHIQQLQKDQTQALKPAELSPGQTANPFEVRQKKDQVEAPELPLESSPKPQFYTPDEVTVRGWSLKQLGELFVCQLLYVVLSKSRIMSWSFNFSSLL